MLDGDSWDPYVPVHLLWQWGDRWVPRGDGSVAQFLLHASAFLWTCLGLFPHSGSAVVELEVNLWHSPWAAWIMGSVTSMWILTCQKWELKKTCLQLVIYILWRHETALLTIIGQQRDGLSQSMRQVGTMCMKLEWVFLLGLLSAESFCRLDLPFAPGYYVESHHLCPFRTLPVTLCGLNCMF